MTHVAKGKNIPPFLILYVADHPDNSAQAQRMDNALRKAEVPVKLFGGRETNHNRLNDNLGKADDAASKAVLEFVAECLKK